MNSSPVSSGVGLPLDLVSLDVTIFGLLNKHWFFESLMADSLRFLLCRLRDIYLEMCERARNGDLSDIQGCDKLNA